MTEPEYRTAVKEMPQLLTIVATAKLLSCSVRTVQRLLASGELTPVRFGTSVRVEAAAIRYFIATHRTLS